MHGRVEIDKEEIVLSGCSHSSLNVSLWGVERMTWLFPVNSGSPHLSSQLYSLWKRKGFSRPEERLKYHLQTYFQCSLQVTKLIWDFQIACSSWNIALSSHLKLSPWESKLKQDKTNGYKAARPLLITLQNNTPRSVAMLLCSCY